MLKTSTTESAMASGGDTVKLKLTIAFDGTEYAGWQFQKSGTAVQELMEKAVEEIFPGGHHVHGSSRTDSGVHARGMVAHVELPRPQFRMPVRKIRLALNARLPEDIRVVEVQQVPVTFHARFDASGKEYRYTVWNHAVMNPMLFRFAWHVPHQLDVRRMKEAAPVFQGCHDFRSFATNHTYVVEDTVRTLTRVELRQSGSQLTFILEGDGFLYRMCRSIVGTLIQLGRGRYALDDIRSMLESKDRRTGGMSAPACGLSLWKVFYRRDGKSVPRRRRLSEPMLAPVSDPIPDPPLEGIQ